MSLYNDLVSFLGPLVGGGVVLVIGISISKKTRELKETGLVAEGIVFDMGSFSLGTGNTKNASPWFIVL